MPIKVPLITDKGNFVEAQAPVIISASRSTDIPAFYAKWFINRLRKGYVIWYNPFNQNPMYISFKNTKVIVFWTKNPKPLIPYLQELDKMGIDYYFQFTLNDYEKERFEPNVPPLDERINTFKQLSNLIGKEKVIWRFDPLIVTPLLIPREILKRIWHVGNQLKGYTHKLVFSFVDINNYKKVQRNLIKETTLFTKETIEYAELNKQQIEEIIEGLVKIQEYWKKEGWAVTLATCAEEIDLKQYNIPHNHCIDGEMMKQLFPQNKELIHYLNYGKLPEKDNLFSDFSSETSISIDKLKDKGQRKICGCMISKDIGMYNTCNHLCIYCYANVSKEVVIKNKYSHTDNSESIIS